MLVCLKTQETTTNCNRLINKNLILQNVGSNYKIRIYWLSGFCLFVVVVVVVVLTYPLA